MSASAIQIQDEKFSSLGLSKTLVNDTQVCCYSRGLGSVSEKNPILVLIHGYPQSSYMWRQLVPFLPSSAPLFAPDLPGYGSSTPIKQNDKLTVGKTLMSALHTQIKRSTSKSPSSDIPVVLIGHDRGARICHRLSVSGVEGFKILGVCLMDIVPTSTQWAASSSVPDMVGYFHWPFLANVSLAFDMITAYGGSRWCNDMILRWAGKNPVGLASLKSDNALEVYGEFFTNPETIRASNEDYRAGAFEDVDMQTEDQKAGRKIARNLGVLLVYSSDYIGRRHDVESEWRGWVEEGTHVKSSGLGNGIGHFLPEEAPQETAKVIREWLEELGVGV